ncbi:MAG TPA: hypothetical protein VGE93_09150, partial [Bryobacteraceae bacterium]
MKWIFAAWHPSAACSVKDTPEPFSRATHFSHFSVNPCRSCRVIPAALNFSAATKMENYMKTMFAALASALLVSTAFAQTAAPAPSTPATTVAQTGKAELKAGT